MNIYIYIYILLYDDNASVTLYNCNELLGKNNNKQTRIQIKQGSYLYLHKMAYDVIKIFTDFVKSSSCKWKQCFNFH